MSDLISREALCEYALNQKDKSITPNDIMRFPSAQPEKRTEKHTETHACDLIDRQAAIDTLDKHLRTTDVPVSYPGIISALTEWLNELPSAQADSKELSFTRNALDTISRQAAIDIVQGYAEQLQGYIGMPNDSEVYAYARGLLLSIDRNIKALPSAQPEIVRCKDCRFHHPNNRCVRIGVYVDDGDCFCCWAERRTDE